MHVELSFTFFGGCILAGFGASIGWHLGSWLMGRLSK